MSAAERHNGQITSKLRSLEASDSRNRGLLKKLRKRKAEMQVFSGQHGPNWFKGKRQVAFCRIGLDIGVLCGQCSNCHM